MQGRRTPIARRTGIQEDREKFAGTRPQGAHDEREAAARVQEMFARITPRYDLLNHLLSLSLDRVWRRRTANRFLTILRRPAARVLDVCCGTGDLTLALDRARARVLCYAAGNRAPVAGSDFVLPMLDRARAKTLLGKGRAVFAAADAMSLPYPDGTFDLVTSAFGFRNLANYEKGMREFARVLKPGGEVGILEFSQPDAGPLASLFRFYFREILPRVGGAISGNREAYSYLPASVGRFPSPDELAALMERSGFREVEFEAWNFGSVLLHRARRT